MNLLAALVLSVSAAQNVELAAARDCLAKLPSSAFTRVPVFLVVDADSSQPAVRRNGALFALRLADRMRAALGYKGGDLPAGDSIQTWQQEIDGVAVTAYRAGHFTWSRRGERPDTGAFGADKVLERALKEAHDAGERVAWPDGSTTDAVKFALSFKRPDVRPGGRVIPLEEPYPVPVFTMLVPWQEPASELEAPKIRFPEVQRTSGIRGSIILEYTIDTTGLVDISSVRDEWPAKQARPVGDLRDAYRAFVSSAHIGLRQARFKPSRIGGCLVRQRVRQQFNFEFSR